MYEREDRSLDDKTIRKLCSVLGLMNDREKRVRLLMDRELLSDQYFGCHPCLNTSSLRIAMEDLTGKILPELGYEPLLVDLPWNPDEENA